MKLPDREFNAVDAVRRDVPLLFGVFGAPGAGKTPSSIRIGVGIREVFGGDLWVIDTEAGRALAYADKYKFKHTAMAPPFGPLDFLKAILDAIRKGARVIDIDTFSHEHSGIGGVLDRHDVETERLADKWKCSFDKASRSGWAAAKAERKQLINHIEQMSKPTNLRNSSDLVKEYAKELADLPPVAFVFSFRAKEKSDQTPDGKFVDLGFMPETDENYLFMLTASALLLPRSMGKPTWRSEKKGETFMIRLPDQFEDIFRDGRQLDERHGREMAEWMKGGGASAPRETATSTASAAHHPPQTAGLSERVRAAVASIVARNTVDGIHKAYARCAALISDLEEAQDGVLIDQIIAARDEKLRELSALVEQS